jgi:hypothetical protein
MALGRDGTVKFSWMNIAKLPGPDQWSTVSGVMDMASGKVTDLTVDGKVIKNDKFTLGKKRQMDNALWQLQASPADADHAVFIDDLKLEVLE